MVNDVIIFQAFASACEGIIPTYLAEAETEEYPYLTYDAVVTPLVTKDGVCGYEAVLTADIYSKDFDEAEAKAGDVADAVADEMNLSGMSAQPASLRKDCVDGVWDITLEWNVRQNID